MHHSPEGQWLFIGSDSYAYALEMGSRFIGYDYEAVRLWGAYDVHYAVKTPFGYLDAAGLLTNRRLAEQYLGGLSLEDEGPALTMSA